MLAFYCLNAAVYFFIKSSFLSYIKNNYTLLFIFVFQSMYNIIINFYLIYIFSLIMLIYFFYSIFSLVFNLLKFTDYKEILNFQLNEFILKRHLLCLIKSSDFFTLIVILIFIIFKIKILVKILFFKYIGLFCCLPILMGLI